MNCLFFLSPKSSLHTSLHYDICSILRSPVLPLSSVTLLSSPYIHPRITMKEYSHCEDFCVLLLFVVCRGSAFTLAAKVISHPSSSLSSLQYLIGGAEVSHPHLLSLTSLPSHWLHFLNHIYWLSIYLTSSQACKRESLFFVSYVYPEPRWSVPVLILPYLPGVRLRWPRESVARVNSCMREGRLQKANIITVSQISKGPSLLQFSHFYKAWHAHLAHKPHLYAATVQPPAQKESSHLSIIRRKKKMEKS